MKTKDKLLYVLETMKGNWVSGEEIASNLSVSRAAVWKAVNLLRENGCRIEAVPKKGYRIPEETDIISELGVWRYLDPQCHDLDIHVLHEVQSTNNLLIEKAWAGAQEGMVMIAGMQTGGKGRFGRRFYSPANTGIYMSLLLCPSKINSASTFCLTAMAAVAACEAIEQVTAKTAEIKWVNDIYVDDRKVCGILTEGAVSVESGHLDHVVIGIGMNAYLPERGFPADIAKVAGVIYDAYEIDGKNRLAAAFLNRFIRWYRSEKITDFIPEYQRRNFVLGKKIMVVSGDISRKAAAVEIDDECRLIVRYDDGTMERLSAGEISIRVDTGGENK